MLASRLGLAVLAIITTAVNSELLCSVAWQSAMHRYAFLHKKILSGQAPQRFLVSVPPSTGLADKLVGLPTQLLWAMLTDRALLAVKKHGFPAYDEIFDFPSINISDPFSLPHFVTDSPNQIDFAHYVERSGRSARYTRLNSKLNFSEFFPICLRNNDSANTNILTKSDLTKYPPNYFNAKYLVVESNRGMSYRLFDNPFHRDTLSSWGLRPETAFGCAMEYLLHIRHETCDRTCRRIRARIAAAKLADITVIGIQVRIGDSSMHDHDPTTLAMANSHFKCAQDLLDQLKENGRKAIYYLISDSISLLEAAKTAHGDRLLADVETRSTHIARCINCSSALRRVHMVQHTANQMFLFSACDFHVVTADSGFGMIGAWMNAHGVSDRVFRVSANSNPVCKKGNYQNVVTDARALATGWSGI